MNKLMCGTCLFQDICTPKYGCHYYSPVDDQAEDDYIDTYIEEERYAFYDDWWKYTAELN